MPLLIFFVGSSYNLPRLHRRPQTADQLLISLNSKQMDRRVLFSASLLFLLMLRNGTPTPTAVSEVSVGVILSLETKPGWESLTSIRMAVDDFYALHNNYTTRIALRVLDSKQNAVDAAAAAVDLMKNSKVAAIIGPMSSREAEFVVVLGNATQTPVISYSASSPSLSVTNTPYFVRATIKYSDQCPLIAAIVKSYGWHQVIPIYEDSVYGAGILPSLIDSLQSVDARVPNRAAIAPSASDDRIAAELYRLKTLPTRIFVVHMQPSLASRLFRIATAAGMLAEGYVWIATDIITNVVDMVGALDLTAMQGVIGVRPHVPSSPELERFTTRWRARLRRENPDDNDFDPSVYQLWAYDATQALAAAVERAFTAGGSDFHWINRTGGSSSIHLAAELGALKAGPQLLAAVQSTSLSGLSGEFRFHGGELNPPLFEIINFVGRGGRTVGFWTPSSGISSELGSIESSAAAKLKVVIWPGESTTVPRGWEVPTGGKKLQIAVPVKNGFNQFVNVERDMATNATTITGFCIDVFDAVMEAMPYTVLYKYIPFKDSAASYDDLVSQVYYKNFDAVVGDTTILANRSHYVDFTLPYTESGVAMVVPLVQDNSRNGWIFLKPLTADLWLGGVAFFFFTGMVVWAIEHRINPEFRGSPPQQIGTTLYFVFAILVFSHKEKLESNLSRLVVLIWVFVVLILTSSYTATLTSMLTVQQLQPKAYSIGQLLQSKNRVGYQDGSFVHDMLQRLGFSKGRLQNYSTPEQYKDAMLKGSTLGGVDVVFDEIPYLNLFLSEYCTDFTMVGRIYKTDGFGFVFPRGSPLVADVSRAMLNVTEGNIMTNIERKWFGDQRICAPAINSSSLDVWRFGGLFLVTGTVSILCVMLHIGIFIWKEWDDLRAAAINSKDGRVLSIWDKIAAWARHYDSFKDNSSVITRNKKTDQELSCKDVVNTDDGLLQLSGTLSISDVSSPNFASPERMVASGS
ncbi:hypothetical protein M5K25_012034 [Dendrobium thyrsiflorum]|uniref:Glutamate receptor n=1 Tax=Dendrobium thyrsiflorum TaxID=117978 RepID=A0ABD0V4Q1_DENTH